MSFEVNSEANPKFFSGATLCLNILGVACIVKEIKFTWGYEENLVQTKIPGELSRATVCTFWERKCISDFTLMMKRLNVHNLVKVDLTGEISGIYMV